MASLPHGTSNICRWTGKSGRPAKKPPTGSYPNTKRPESFLSGLPWISSSLAIEVDGPDQAAVGITLENHFGSVAILKAGNNYSPLTDPTHLWIIQSQPVGFFHCPARAADFAAWRLAVTVLTVVVIRIVAGSITTPIVVVVATVVIDAGTASQINVDVEISGIGAAH